MQFDDTLAIFAGDQTLSFRGHDSVALFERIKTLFEEPRAEIYVEQQDPQIHKMLSSLIGTGILLETQTEICFSFWGTSHLNRALESLIKGSLDALCNQKPILICFPDDKGLSIQREALASLKQGQFLLTGIYRGTSVFVLPLISDPKANILSMLLTLLSTESGVGNLYLAEELTYKSALPSPHAGLADKAATWVASDLYALILNGVLTDQTAHIYRGSFVTREDVSFSNISERLQSEQTVEEKAYVLERMFVGQGKLISRYREYYRDIGGKALYATHADMARTTPLYCEEREELGTWGTGYTRSTARLKAFMEAIERYSISSYSVDDFPLCPRDELTLPVLDRKVLGGYGSLDQQCDDLSPEIPRRWHPVRNYFDGGVCMVPLELVRYPVPFEATKYCSPDQITSSGVAAHLSFDLALQSACHELVRERRIFDCMVAKSRSAFNRSGVVAGQRIAEIGAMKENGWSIRIMDMSTDLAPVVCALISRNSVFYRHSIGTSSDDDKESACLKALQEASINFRFFEAKPKPAAEVLKELSAPKDHMELYAGGEHDDVLLKFFGSSELRKFPRCEFFPAMLSIGSVIQGCSFMLPS